MRFLSAAAMVVLVAGCTSTAERQARNAQFVGRPATELAKVMGPPARIQEAGTTEFLTYQDWHKQTVPGNPFCFGPGPFCGGGGFPPPRMAPLVCNSTFAVSGGVVRGYNVGGDGCG
jgi:hypothetical protein